MKMVYAEIGFGNKSFLSTEFEIGKKEYRVSKFIFPKKIKEIYFKIWILKKVMIISFFKGFIFQSKDKNKLKILIGIGGISK